MQHNWKRATCKKVPCGGIRERSAAWAIMIATTLLLSPQVWAAPFVYVTRVSSNVVSIIDAATNTFVVDVDVPVCVGPNGVALTPDGTEAYVACMNSPSVSVINTATNTVTHNPSLPPGSRSQGIAITPDGTKAYVVIQDSNAVAIIDTASKTFIGSISGGFNSPFRIAITPDGKKAYVTNFGIASSGTTVTVINLLTDTVTSTVDVGREPNEVAITPDGTKAYVMNGFSPTSVSVIDTATDTVVATIPISGLTGSVAIKPDGSEVWASSGIGGISIIDPAMDTVINTIPLIVQRMAFTSDGSRVYAVLPGSPNMAVIDTSTYMQIATVTLGDSDLGQVAVTPPPPTCSSLVTTVDELRAEVNALTTSDLTIQDLNESLDKVQANLDKDKNEKARLGLVQFTKKVTILSNPEGNADNLIPLNEANSLICGAANVLIGITLP